MDFVKQKNFRLNQIIKNCRSASYQSYQLKKSLNLQEDRPKIQKNNGLKNRSQSLLKKSRMQINVFKKRHKKTNSYQQSLNPLARTKTVHLQDKKKTVHLDSQNSELVQEHHKSQIQEQQDNQRTKLQQLKTYFPYISSVYRQTFKPKNASLSHYSIVQNQLQNSVHRQRFKNQNKFDKQNVMKQYLSRNEQKEQKLDKYKLEILKEISQQNARKYLSNKNSSKQKIALILLKQKP